MPMPFLTTPCLAAGLDWLEGLLPALFVGFWILSQVFALFRRVPRQAAPRQPAPEVPRERPLRPDPAADFGGGAPDREEIARQIEDFLLGSNRRPTPEPQPVKPAARPTQKRRSESRRAQQSQPQPAPAMPPRPLPVPSPVQAGRLDAFDSDVARHVHDAFAHDLAHRDASLGHDAAAPTVKREAASAASASQLAQLLRSPATIRQVVMLREVLERPTERWEQ